MVWQIARFEGYAFVHDYFLAGYRPVGAVLYLGWLFLLAYLFPFLEIVQFMLLWTYSFFGLVWIFISPRRRRLFPIINSSSTTITVGV